MLLKKAQLEAIKAGEVSLVFRRWRRPTVKSGSTLKTAIGVLGIDRVVEVGRADITETDATKAGWNSVESLLAALDTREGAIYRIEIHYAGTDPRIELRECDDLTDAEFDELHERLRRLDAASRVGAWTHRVLRSIEDHPRLAAGELAHRLRLEKEWLKVNIRKLKNLGLTISHQAGYEISPRGRAVLSRLPSEADR